MGRKRKEVPAGMGREPVKCLHVTGKKTQYVLVPDLNDDTQFVLHGGERMTELEIRKECRARGFKVKPRTELLYVRE